MTKIIISAVIGILVLGGVWWVKQGTSSDVKILPTDQVRVVTTFYPLQQFAEAVIGDAGTVDVVVPAGVEPHEYEPSAQDIKKVYSADIFLLNGAGLDPWAEKIMPELEKQGVKALRFADLVSLLPGSEEGNHGHEEGASAEEEAEEVSEWDPHFWLDPVFVEKEAHAIAAALSEQFPEKKPEFETNRDGFVTELKKLDTEYKAGLTTCRVREVVTTHTAFGYLAKRYGFEVHSISGLSPENEPSPRRLTELSNEIRSEGIRYVLFETLVSPTVAETLARSAGIETLVFNPIEGITDEEKAAGKNYLSLMRENLSTLRKALECK